MFNSKLPCKTLYCWLQKKCWSLWNVLCL